MAVHVAIIQRPYDQLILEGRKTIECRLTRQRRPPFGAVVPGERLYLKRSGGSFFGVAVADRVWMSDSLTPRAVRELKERYNERIHGADEYWKQRETARYGTLIWLRQVVPCTVAPPYRPQKMRAWYVLDDGADPLSEDPGGGEGMVGVAGVAGGGAPFEVELTAGAIRQRSVRVAGLVDRFPAGSVGGRSRAEAGQPVELRLRGGPTVATDIVGPMKMLRYRGWAPWFEQHRLEAGDRLRFIPDGRGGFDVEPVKR